MKKYLIVITIILSACNGIPYEQQQAINNYNKQSKFQRDATFNRVREDCHNDSIKKNPMKHPADMLGLNKIKSSEDACVKAKGYNN